MRIGVLSLACLCLAGGARAQPSFTIDLERQRQTIQGFGATATGMWIPEVAALYGEEVFVQRARELGVSIVRLALPPDIQAQEDLDAESLKLESFDFSKFSPPANFIRALRATEPGLKVILSIWSPPAWMKTNASVKNGGSLRPDRHAHFAKFCAAACLGFEKTFGVPVHAISIQNEPAFTEPYESCTYTPEQMRDVVRQVSLAFSKWKVTSRIAAPEDVAHDPRWMKFAAAVTASPGVAFLNIHNEPEREPARNWPRFQAVAARARIPLWMTETSGEQPTWTAEGKPGALDLARKIHDALTYGQCEAWVYWAFTDPAPSEFALMALADPTPKFYAARQYFKFIRPGARRVEVKETDRAILVSAFHHEERREVVMVLLNMGDAASAVKIALASPPEGLKTLDGTRSSSTERSAMLPRITLHSHLATLSLPPKSITTLHSTY